MMARFPGLPKPIWICLLGGGRRGLRADRLLALGPMLGRPVSPRQVVRGINQGDVRERLGKVSDLAFGSRSYSCQQSNIVAQP
jgi:hypothetical protein